MAFRYDIALTNNDIYLRDGDFLIAQSDQQHILDTMAALPGWWKENPLDGVGIVYYDQAPAIIPEISRKIRVELNSDGYVVNNPIITLDKNGLLTVDPNIKNP